MTTLIHRASLNGTPQCQAPHGRISTSGCVVTCPECTQRDHVPHEGTTVYAVKCDDCKRIITLTYSLRESAAGGRCRSCTL